MLKCLICGWVGLRELTGPSCTCPRCGEASWDRMAPSPSALSAPLVLPPEVTAPSADPMRSGADPARSDDIAREDVATAVLDGDEKPAPEAPKNRRRR
jgi:hypothetical protein